MRNLTATTLIAAVGLLLPTTAYAQPTKDDIAKADALFREAQSAIQSGNLADACKKFAESQQLDPANGTLINLALCHEKEGKVATAYRELQELLAIMSTSKNPNDHERTRVATAEIKILDKKIPRVMFDVSALPKDVALTLDGEKIGDLSTPSIVDPGTHTVDAAAAGKKPGTATFEIREPGTHTVKIEGLIDEPVAAPPPPIPPKKAPPPPKPSYWSNQRILGAGVAGVGLVGVGVGAVFGLQTFSKRDDRDAHCVDTICDAEGIRLHDAAKSSALISSIAFAVGGVAVAAGAFLFFSAPSTAAPLKVDVGIGPGSAVLRGAF